MDPHPPASPLSLQDKLDLISHERKVLAVLRDLVRNGLNDGDPVRHRDSGAHGWVTVLRTQVASNLNPPVFTSATEQWVSWTLAVFLRQASNTFAVTYQALSSVSATLSSAYAVLAAEVGGSAWFSRLTNGFHTWAPYGAAQFVVTQELDAQYDVGGQVSAYFSATYRAGETVSGYDDSWFPRLTDGFNTWAGETVAVVLES